MITEVWKRANGNYLLKLRQVNIFMLNGNEKGMDIDVEMDAIELTNLGKRISTRHSPEPDSD